MIAAVIALAIAVGGAVGGLVAIAAWLHGALNARGAALEQLLAEQRRGDQILTERNQAVARAAGLEIQNAELERRLEAAELARNTATKEAADHVADSIRNQPSAADALAALNAELHAPGVPGGAGAHPAAAGDPGPAAAAVSPAAGADVGGDRGRAGSG